MNDFFNSLIIHLENIHEGTFFYNVLSYLHYILFPLVVIFIVVIIRNILFTNLIKKSLDSQESLRNNLDVFKTRFDFLKKLQKDVMYGDSDKPKGIDYHIYCRPLEQVGGDYFNVSVVNNKNIFCIGDVTGHGYTALLLLLMVHIVIKNIISFGLFKSKEILVHLNKILKQHIINLSTAKSVNILFIDNIIDTNTFNYAGRHESIFIMRADSNEIEEIDTFDNGFPIAILDDIEDLVEDNSFVLGDDDIVFLYTDGFTQLMEVYLDIPDNDIKYCNIEEECKIKIKELLFSQKGKSTKEIVSYFKELIDKFKYFQKDDVTIVAFKISKKDTNKCK